MAVWSRGCQLCCHASGFALSCMELHATDWLNSGIVLVSCSSSQTRETCCPRERAVSLGINQSLAEAHS